jgi:hypothetical protein
VLLYVPTHALHIKTIGTFYNGHGHTPGHTTYEEHAQSSRPWFSCIGTKLFRLLCCSTASRSPPSGLSPTRLATGCFQLSPNQILEAHDRSARFVPITRAPPTHNIPSDPQSPPPSFIIFSRPSFPPPPSQPAASWVYVHEYSVRTSRRQDEKTACSTNVQRLILVRGSLDTHSHLHPHTLLLVLLRRRPARFGIVHYNPWSTAGRRLLRCFPLPTST